MGNNPVEGGRLSGETKLTLCISVKMDTKNANI
jgi:hypothetical protein